MKNFRNLLIFLANIVTIDAAAQTQTIDHLQISGEATNGSTYIGRVDFNTTTFDVYNGSFTVNNPEYGQINLSYQDPVPYPYENWCDVYQNMWCSHTVNSNFINNQTYPTTYYALADTSAFKYFIYFELNALSPLTPVDFVFSSNGSYLEYLEQSFVSYEPCTSVYSDPNLCIDPRLARATESITLLGTTTIDVPGFASSVPEPSSIALLASGILGVGVLRRKCRRAEGTLRNVDAVAKS